MNSQEHPKQINVVEKISDSGILFYDVDGQPMIICFDTDSDGAFGLYLTTGWSFEPPFRSKIIPANVVVNGIECAFVEENCFVEHMLTCHVSFKSIGLDLATVDALSEREETAIHDRLLSIVDGYRSDIVNLPDIAHIPEIVIYDQETAKRMLERRDVIMGHMKKAVPIDWDNPASYNNRRYKYEHFIRNDSPDVRILSLRRYLDRKPGYSYTNYWRFVDKFHLWMGENTNAGCYHLTTTDWMFVDPREANMAALFVRSTDFW